MENARERREMHTKFGSENLKGRDHSKDRNRRKDNIRIDLMEIGWEGVEWMYLPQDRDQWRDFVNAVMKLRAP
jgi:hypothetical protein